jgi:hypothetical protein
MKFKAITIVSVLSTVAAFSPTAKIGTQSVSSLETPTRTSGWNVARSMVASSEMDTVNGSMNSNGQRKKTKEVRKNKLISDI